MEYEYEYGMTSPECEPAMMTPVACAVDPAVTIAPWGLERDLQLANGHSIRVVTLRPGVTAAAVPVQRAATVDEAERTVWNRLRDWLLD